MSKSAVHSRAKPSHYNKEAESYDAFNEKSSEQINQLIERALDIHKVKTVLDLTCGTGSQVLWLAKRGMKSLELTSMRRCSTLQNEDGILASYDTYYEQKGTNKPKMSKSSQTLQVYSARQLREMLERNGFQILDQCGTDGSKFTEDRTERILTIAKRV